MIILNLANLNKIKIFINIITSYRDMSYPKLFQPLLHYIENFKMRLVIFIQIIKNTRDDQYMFRIIPTTVLIFVKVGVLKTYSLM